MRVFTVLGVIFLVVGVGLALVPMLPGSGGFWDEFRDQGAFIAALTFIPMGIVFTAIGLVFGRMTAGRKRLLREGIPGQATIVSLEGGNLVVNNVNYMITFQLRVALPGRAPYDVRHRQLVPIFALASLPIGGTVPVLVDPRDATKLTIDLAGEAMALRQAAAVGPAGPAQVVPNTLSTMQGATPNTFGSELAQGALPMAPGWSAGPGVTVDPGLLTRSIVTMGRPMTIDASATGQVVDPLLSNGRPGSALIREATDTGIDVRGDSVVELTLDVTPQGGAPYAVRAAALVPAAAQARAVPGAVVPVRIDPARPDSVAVDWLH